MLPRPNRRARVALAAVLLITACAHRNGVSQRAVRQLVSRGAPFVLVFGSLTTPTGRPAKPTIRFVYQTDRAHPQYLLAAFDSLERSPVPRDPAPAEWGRLSGPPRYRGRKRDHRL